MAEPDVGAPEAGGHPFGARRTGAALVDPHGVVQACSATAAALVGRLPREVVGTRLRDLVVRLTPWDTDPDIGRPRDGRAVLRHTDGHEVDVAFQVHELAPAGPSHLLLAVAPAEMVETWRQNHAIVRALFTQEAVGIALHGPDLRLLRTNIAPEELGGPAEMLGRTLAEILVPEDAKEIEERLARVAETGKPLLNWEHGARVPNFDEDGSVITLSAFRLLEPDGRTMGVATTFFDVTESHRARTRLELLHTATATIGATLSVEGTARELADVFVPAFADLAAVDLSEPVLLGDEPPAAGAAGTHLVLVRAAAARATGGWPAGLAPEGATSRLAEDTEGMARLRRGRGLLADDARARTAGGPDDPAVALLATVPETHTVMSAPLHARGLLLGTVTLWRYGRRPAFDPADLELLEEVAARAALGVDNARRFTREHRAAVGLQRSLLPPSEADVTGAVTAAVYLPADVAAGVGGDWFDVIPLPSARVALVVGDVVGHGLHATATMGRLRTAVQTLADLELPPDELLTHLDDLVLRLAVERDPASVGVGERESIGGTCLYAIYNAVSRVCTAASAGHPPPALVTPRGDVEFVPVNPGPPLGVGGLPFELVQFDVPDGSVLALYTDGLVERGLRDIGEGMERLRGSLVRLGPGLGERPLIEAGREVVRDLPPTGPADDITLLLVRTRALPESDTMSWTLPADPAIVSRARELSMHQLRTWDLDHLAFTTELIVSELVTNAIRHAGGPVELRLIREHTLVCEVSDPSSTQPRLRRARETDEGGRGLYLVAQLAARWGSRYTANGKTIWAEQSLDILEF